MRRTAIVAAAAAGALLAACQPAADGARDFPKAERDVSALGSNQFSTETQRDSVGEAQRVMTLADIQPGMTVADIGAGEGYYTIRLSDRVGPKGRVLAEDIDRAVLERLGQRVERERLDNVSIKLGLPDNAKLPANSFDRVFMVHMYHEVQEPYAFLWNLWPALREGGRVIVVDVDRPTGRHGIPPLLLSCEFAQVGFQLDTFVDAPELAGYYAQFKRQAKRPEPQAIKPCHNPDSAPAAH